ncbi:peptidyl-tRNA hydrolase [Bartonella henselae]|uniref:Peptidyl-tRNA hydrolase n=1 Tax=Bartonella henselae (strain ATCC 49882 / DSM 28221 / CCUG 30454 / Houston 1) TaxID=283166 RepID=PTH_BARHE|nr:aminoacyl-tRNA hydrolase [Bartonella henselae]Q6G2L1.1 RecName: Full=Peptidyl-tRNA hydrolase; Short=PTH [Bartonella henselae str. Houston-1]ATP12667.1 peptidyl-tRNA hydrolase [Bartonella henselae]ETS08286.1 peptidyl-tRNA hydrolase [Bartonella henselae JK 50]ETS08835.1 peptidyl-tRNA hydrolase [Bartonella henselae JK 51]ETS11386.1 peptidyl-tRNA hydrolase [Bartonella henselae JK 42]ETS15391.1 peptidyl-tRNA hydrolase [Bartonella henselae JK 41]
MWLIAGLGNPGLQYQNNRHNIGFMAIDAIYQSFSFSPWSKKFQAEISTGLINGKKTFLLKPQTFMNLSGQAIGEALRFYKLDLKNFIVIYDELDLPPGRVRVKIGGGNNGHNGIKSIDAHCGTDYCRIRLGIGRPNSKELVYQHVLGNFTKSDQEWLPSLLEAIAKNIALLIKGNKCLFMNEISQAMKNKNLQ